MSKLFLGLVCVFCFSLQGRSQDERYTEYGAGIGAAIYQGDISPYSFGTIKRPGFSVHLSGNFSLSSALSVRLNYTFAFLSESDKNYSFTYKPLLNFNFETKVNDFGAQLVYNPLRNNSYEEYRSVTPYLFAGIGIAMLDITRDWKDFHYSYPAWQKWVLPGLVEDSLHTLPKFTMTLPVGAGLRYMIEENVSLFAEVTQRFTNQEYLDGFSKAANRKKRDGFATVTIGVIFRRFNDYTSRRIRYY